jgi:hypothetical protein
MMDVGLRRRDHTYHVLEDGVWHRVPGVNEIVRAAVPTVTRFFSEASRERGNVVHEALALHLSNNGLDWESLSDEHRPYVEQGVSALMLAEARPAHVEEILYHPILRFAGRPDFVGGLWRRHTLAVVDHKTGAVPKIAGLTTAGYAILARSIPRDSPVLLPIDRYALELKPDDFKFVPLHTEVDGHLDEPRFLACLDLYRSFSFREERDTEGYHVEPFDPNHD